MKKILALALCLVMAVSLAACAGSKEGTDTDSQGKVTESPSPNDAAETPADSEEPGASAPADDDGAAASGTLGNYEVSIISAELIEDYEGNPAVYVTYEWTNNSDTETSFLFALASYVYQNDVSCEIATLSEDIAEINDALTDIQQGETITVAEAYLLQDTENPIDVEVEELMDFSDSPPQVIATFEF